MESESYGLEEMSFGFVVSWSYIRIDGERTDEGRKRSMLGNAEALILLESCKLGWKKQNWTFSSQS